MSVEQGRDAQSNLSRQGSVGLGKRFGSSELGEPNLDMDVDFPDVDLGLDFGAQPELPELENRSRRASKYTR